MQHAGAALPPYQVVKRLSSPAAASIHWDGEDDWSGDLLGILLHDHDLISFVVGSMLALWCTPPANEHLVDETRGNHVPT
jgi:hypothetical protein